MSKSGNMALLAITDGTLRVDLLSGGGWRLGMGGWNPQVAQFKGGGSKANSAIADGQRLVDSSYDNVVETIPLSAVGIDENLTLKTVRALQQLLKQASDYWTSPSEYDPVWIEARPACSDCLTGYARIVQGSIPELTNVFGPPFHSSKNESAMEDLTLAVEREPFWRGTPPGEIVGPLYNLLKNPDFELWNSGVADSQPDSWSDLETLWVAGQNSRGDSNVKWGRYALKVRVSMSVQAGATKGVTQVVDGTEDGQTYTLVGWVRSEGVSNGVGRILITGLLDQHEAWRSSARLGWTLVAHKFTTGTGDVIGVNCDILSTALGTDGTVYFDSLMVLKGDWVAEAENGTLPYMTSSHVYNHWDSGAGHVNWVDAWQVPGDADALVRLEVKNNSTIADENNVVERIAELRVGQRRTNDVQNLQNYYDPTGVADATGSESNRVTSPALTPVYQTIATQLITGATNTRDNEGRFRAFARVWDTRAGTSNLLVRLAYSAGVSAVAEKQLDAVTPLIRGDWCIVDLTPRVAIVRDYKHSPDPMGQLGVKLQFSRPVGADTAYLDYLLMLPTDGGALLVQLDPGVEPGTAVVADNTGSGQVSASGVRAGYRVEWNSNYTGTIGSMANFKEHAYAGGWDMATNAGVLFRRRAGEVGGWSLAATFADLIRENSMEIYNGSLHVGTGAGTARVHSSPTGTAFTNIYNPTSESGVYGMKAFEGYLWTGGTRRVGHWDGSSYVQSVDFGVGGNGVSLESYKNQLFAAVAGLQTLYVKQAGVDVWSSVGALAGAERTMHEFDGKLYIAEARYIQVYDGSAIATVKDFTAGYNVNALEVHDGKLYATVTSAALTTKVYGTEDGVTWTLVYDPEAVDLSTPYAMLGEQDRLSLGGTQNNFIKIVSFVADQVVQYGGGIEYEGGTFTAPNRRLPADPRRHRWVFSFDREDHANAIGDRVLVGIGYVSRYLSLRGHD